MPLIFLCFIHFTVPYRNVPVSQKVKSKVPKLVPWLHSNRIYDFLPPGLSHPSWSLELVCWAQSMHFFLRTFVLGTPTVWVSFSSVSSLSSGDCLQPWHLLLLLFISTLLCLLLLTYVYIFFYHLTACLETVTLFYVQSEFNNLWGLIMSHAICLKFYTKRYKDVVSS